MSTGLVLLNGTPRDRVFLGTMDPVAEPWAPAGVPDNAVSIRLLSMMGVDAVTAAPYLWQAPKGRELVSATASLMESSRFTLLGRPDNRSAREYLSAREADTSGLRALSGTLDRRLASEVPPPWAGQLARELDAIAPLAPRSLSVESVFKRTYVDDLGQTDAPTSLYRITQDTLPVRFSRLARTQHEVVASRLSEAAFAPHFSRAVVESTYRSAGERPRNELLSLRVTALYQAANAQAADATLFTWHAIEELVPSGTPTLSERSLHPLNPMLFAAVLRAADLPLRAVAALSDAEFAELVAAPETSAFVSWYRETVETVLHWSGGEAAPLLDYVTSNASTQRRSGDWLSRLDQMRRRHIDDGVALVAALATIAVTQSPITATKAGLSVRRTARTAEAIVRRRFEAVASTAIPDFERLLAATVRESDGPLGVADHKSAATHTIRRLTGNEPL